MKRTFLFFTFLLLVSTYAYGLWIDFTTGPVKAPKFDGNFDNTKIATQVTVFFYLVDENTYQTFKDDPQCLYSAWMAGEFDSSKYQTQGNITEFGEYDEEIYCDTDDVSDIFYLVAIATHDSVNYGRSYYIARALCEEYTVSEGLDFDVVAFPQAISGAGRWEVIYNEPPSITCTDLCVTGGVVSATYSISEFSRLNEIVSGEATSVIVAADLARTTQTNLAASVTATNSGESTFTFSFNPAEQNWTNSTLFIFGVEPPR